MQRKVNTKFKKVITQANFAGYLGIYGTGCGNALNFVIFPKLTRTPPPSKLHPVPYMPPDPKGPDSCSVGV